MTCSCPEIFAGPNPTGSRNWNPNCTEHGTSSVWWNSEEEQERRTKARARTIELQRLARENRRKGLSS